MQEVDKNGRGIAHNTHFEVLESPSNQIQQPIPAVAGVMQTFLSLPYKIASITQEIGALLMITTTGDLYLHTLLKPQEIGSEPQFHFKKLVFN